MKGRRHLFHIVNPSLWPLLVSISAFYFVSGIAFYMHNVAFGGYFLLYGLSCVIYCSYFWFSDIVDEATCSGYHTQAVRMGIKKGFILFVISEVMLFFGFFWAFFHASISPAFDIGMIYPPVGIEVISAWEFPMFNTAVLIVSGLSITWAHHGISLGSFKTVIDAFVITIILGLLFVLLQMFEYGEAMFNFSDGVYGCCFYMLTGLHGCHVLAGVTFIVICFIRLLKRHYLRNHYLGFVFASWYWHFVDIVWIFLFLTVYIWGNWTV